MEQRAGAAATDRRRIPDSPRSAPSSLSSDHFSAMPPLPSSRGFGRRRRDGTAVATATTAADAADVESRGDGKPSGSSPRQANDGSDGGIGGGAGGMIVLRKIVRVACTNLDDDAMMRDDTERILIYITLTKEAIIGLLIAMFVVSLVLFVDHQFVLGLPTARTFRRATFQLMNDNETLANLEEAAGIKFLEREEHAAMLDEVAKAANRTKLAQSIFQQRASDLEKWKKDLGEYIAELPQLIEGLELHDYCERCLWERDDSLACLNKGRAVGQKYQTAELASLVEGIKRKSCEVVEDRLVAQWNDTDNDFCGSCAWQLATKPRRVRGKKKKGKKMVPCDTRAAFLSYKGGIRRSRAKVRLMIEQPRCRASVREEELRMNRFCQYCMWDGEVACRQRATQLMVEEKLSAKKAILTAMEEKEACVKEEETEEVSAKPEGRASGSTENEKGRFRTPEREESPAKVEGGASSANNTHTERFKATKDNEEQSSDKGEQERGQQVPPKKKEVEEASAKSEGLASSSDNARKGRFEAKQSSDKGGQELRRQEPVPSEGRASGSAETEKGRVKGTKDISRGWEGGEKARASDSG